jgi:hypothetical protein
VVHSERRLYLVFEYLDLDLKKLMDAMPAFNTDPRRIKVCAGMCQGIVWAGRVLHGSLRLAPSAASHGDGPMMWGQQKAVRPQQRKEQQWQLPAAIAAVGSRLLLCWSAPQLQG